jgi:hypothetical protein
MSQPNNNFPHPFELVVQEHIPSYAFNHSAQQTSNNTPPWIQSRPRSVQNNMSSPSPSVRSTVTAPLQKSFDQTSFHHTNIAIVDNRNDPSLLSMDMLAPSGHVARSMYNPLDRHYHDESWNPYHLRNSGTNDDRTRLHQSNGGFKSHRAGGPGSMSSVAPISDSGFYSQSVVSHDTGHRDQSGMHCGLTQQVGNLNVRSTISEAPGMVRMHSDQRSHFSQASSQSGSPHNALQCRDCDKILKCNSDYKCVPYSYLFAISC